MLEALQRSGLNALIEASLLGTFMVSACATVLAVQHPASPVRRAVPSATARRMIIGVVMGLTAIALIYSPLGQRSGAHMNPAVTLTFLVLGKINALDSALYIAGQFVGGCAGVALAHVLLSGRIAHEHVNYAATQPGRHGVLVAWIAELTIAFLMMTMVLWTTNTTATLGYTGLIAGAMVACFITIEAPLSGMSMNPARTFGSAIPARAFRGLWIYFTAPPIAMLLAAGTYVGIRGNGHVHCCKLSHPDGTCQFHCTMDQIRKPATP